MARIKTLGEVGTPKTDFEIANKKYVDDASGGAGALEHIVFSTRQLDFDPIDEWVTFGLTGTGTSSNGGVRAPIPFDMTIVRLGVTVALSGLNNGFEVPTNVTLSEFSSTGAFLGIKIMESLPILAVNFDRPVNFEATSIPGNSWAWRINNNSTLDVVIRYEIHFHYVETEILNKFPELKKYYKTRADSFTSIQSYNQVSTYADKMKKVNDEYKRLSKINQAKSTAVITPTEGITTVDNGTTAVKETNREQRHKSKKKVKSVHWKKLKSNEI